MRPWIRSLSNILPKRPLRDDFLATNMTFWSKINLFGIWKIQIVEQVQLVSDLTLPASETINQTFKNMNYNKKLKICMRPWIRSLFLMTFLVRVTLVLILFNNSCWVKFDRWFQRLGVSEPTPDGLALHFEFVKSPKGSLQERQVDVDNLRNQGRMHIFEKMYQRL